MHNKINDSELIARLAKNTLRCVTKIVIKSEVPFLTVSCVVKVCIHFAKRSFLVSKVPNDTLKCFEHT